MLIINNIMYTNYYIINHIEYVIDLLYWHINYKYGHANYLS